MDKPPYDTISWDDATDLGRNLRAYQCYDNEGRLIIMNPKNRANHESFHPLQEHPALFYNLRQVVSDPHGVIVNPTSNNPTSIENRQKGDIIVYSRKGFAGGLDFPDHPDFDAGSDQVSVVVLYEKDGGSNYSLTYGIGIDYGN